MSICEKPTTCCLVLLILNQGYRLAGDFRSGIVRVFFKAVTSFLALPGFIAGIIPWLIFVFDPWRVGRNLYGIPSIVIGLIILVWCVRDFYVAGKGTLAPWSAPRRLVIVGLYRYCRNPMYIGVLVIVAGWAIFASSLVLFSYLTALAIAFHLRVVLYEEPRLSELFGPQWQSYAGSVPRWLPRIHPT